MIKNRWKKDGLFFNIQEVGEALGNLTKGDKDGHPFRGNQWTEGRGANGKINSTRVRDFFPDLLERGIKIKNGLIFETDDLGTIMKDYRHKLGAAGFEEVGGISLDLEEFELQGAELNFQKPTGDAINVYMRTDGLETAVLFDEEPMDSNGALHSGDMYVPGFLGEL